jgi:hypothetical protein
MTVMTKNFTVIMLQAHCIAVQRMFLLLYNVHILMRVILLQSYPMLVSTVAICAGWQCQLDAVHGLNISSSLVHCNGRTKLVQSSCTLPIKG